MRSPGIIGLSGLLVAVAAPAPGQTVDRTACERLTAHRPSPDTVYRPGMDVRGRPVPPADLPGPRLEFPEGVGVDLIAPAPGLSDPRDRPPPYRGEIYAGAVTVGPDGTVFFNGRPLSDPEAERLASLCRERRDGR